MHRFLDSFGCLTCIFLLSLSFFKMIILNFFGQVIYRFLFLWGELLEFYKFSSVVSHLPDSSQFV